MASGWPRRTPRWPGCSPAAGCCPGVRGRRRRRRATRDAGPGRPVRGGARRLERWPPSGPLLLVVEDVHWADQSTRDLLTFLFTRPLPRPGRDRGVVPLRRPAPPPPAAATAAPVGPAARRRTGCSSSPLADDDVRALVRAACPRPALRGRGAARIVRRAEGNAFFAEELVGAADGRRAGRRRCPTTSPTCCWSGSTGSTTPPARWCARPPCAGPPGRARRCSPRSSGSTTTRSTHALRAAVEQNVLVRVGERRLRLPARAAGRGRLRRPAARRAGPAARRLRRGAGASGACRGTAAELARHARAAHDRDTAVGASIAGRRRGDAVGGPDEAAHHYETALELLGDPRLEVKVDLVGLVTRAADALMASGAPERAHQLLAAHLRPGVAPGATSTGHGCWRSWPRRRSPSTAATTRWS